MYAVIFKAEILELDPEYTAMSEKLQRMAKKYGCKEFTSCTEGKYEISISYWENESQIKEWRNNSEHLVAQGAGRDKWYKSYSVQVVEVVREYSSRK